MREASLRLAVAAWIHCSLVLRSGEAPSATGQLKKAKLRNVADTYQA